MKGIFVLAALAFIWLSMPSGSGAVSGVDTSDLYYSFQSQGETWKQPRLFPSCEVVDGAMVCTAVVRVNMPPQAYRLLQCEPEGENCTVLKTFDGEESCHLLIKHGGRDAVTPECVWGTGHLYTLVAPVGVTGEVDLSYTHEPQLNPDTGKPWPRQQTTVFMTKECKRAMREMARTGDYGPVPECAGSRYYKAPDAPVVPVE